jgi:hypothetical protein
MTATCVARRKTAIRLGVAYAVRLFAAHLAGVATVAVVIA